MEASTRVYWCILHGGMDRGDLYWCGFDRTLREHQFKRNREFAVRFYREQDALKAGVGLTQGIRIKA